ncbi:hypothetical protein [Streptomyces gilvosporeus]|uniref:Uncharacterized protein n=1 Tax=Streptomyces gilvosporeus TaxID=553510 RepID=A0A1V0TMH8_9ACTN|nr:hypothetical protein [Streptomyces gilvosporeus]ARF54060.1 hypothetical protein B1H19_07520 [Streptomyces gilvosporeus]
MRARPYPVRKEHIAGVPAGPQDGDLTDELAQAYWSLYDGAAAKTTVRQVLARLPAEGAHR